MKTKAEIWVFMAEKRAAGVLPLLCKQHLWRTSTLNSVHEVLVIRPFERAGHLYSQENSIFPSIFCTVNPGHRL